MYELILIFHVIISCALVGMVLLQQGKGAEVGAAFGSGASQTIFGAQGSGSFITRATAVLAALFFTTSLTLTYLATQSSKQAQQLSLPNVPMQQQLPAQPVGDVPELPVAPNR